MAGKMKTHSWAKKRFKTTKKWKLVSKKSGNNHLLTNKWENHKSFKYGKLVPETHVKNIKSLLPYS